MGVKERRIELLLEKARNASEGPGVYRMLDQHAKILYVGKAKSLHKRVRSYFQGTIDEPKTKTLVSKVHDFDVILTNTEAEALILESILIKKHKPRYNILLRDDKSYPYVVVDEGHTYPKLIYARRPRKNKNSKIYGPFASATALREALRLINRSFRLRDCSDSEFANRSRPCINHQIGICSAPCTALISPEDYKADVQRAIQVLQGNGQQVLGNLNSEMEQLAEKMEFEQAARLRDQINFLQETIARRKQGKVIERGHSDGGNRDVIGWYRKPDAATIALLFVRNGDLVDSASFHLDGIEGKTDEEVLAQFVAQFYLTDDPMEELETLPSGTFAFPGAEGKTKPEEILLPFEFPEMELIRESFASLSHKMKFSLPQKGVKHDLLELAVKNAENAFEEKQREKGSIYRVLSDLKVKLRLENYPRRMECFDISNLGDTGIVASRVTFIEGKADKSLYRHYKIRSTSTQNDFASMREVIERRLLKTLENAHSFEEPPDLLIIDGGKGQLSMAMEVIKELNITGLDVVALAKAKKDSEVNEFVEPEVESQENSEEVASADDADPSEPVTTEEGRAFEGREVIKNFERVFKPGRLNPIVLAPDSPVCHLMQRIRDEAHRFAVEFQRKQRKSF